MTADTAEHDTAARPASRGFEDFYRNRRDQVFRGLALTLRDRDLAADATDEAMARAYQHWGSVRNHNNPEGWVYRVGLNWARSRIRRSQREVAGFRLEETPAPFQREPSDPHLVAALLSLPLKQRAVIVLRFYFDWSTEQVAKSLGIPNGTVKSRLARALQRLEESTEMTT